MVFLDRYLLFHPLIDVWSMLLVLFVIFINKDSCTSSAYPYLIGMFKYRLNFCVIRNMFKFMESISNGGFLIAI